MSSRYYRLDDDRELAPAPIFLNCERCGAPVVLADEGDDDDDEVICLACVRARQALARMAS